MKRLLLISNSTQHGGGYLDHAENAIRDLLGSTSRVAFVPFAVYDRNSYALQAQCRFQEMGYTLVSVHDVSNPGRLIAESDAVFVGGGNTFRLLKGLYDFNLLAAIRNRVEAGAGYVGSSAGSIVACPTLKTTKDMPIAQPPSFDALGLVNFQISPHYLDPDPNSTHMGETHAERILQFLEENDLPVVGLREGSMLRVEGERITLNGSTGARIFRRGKQPVEIPPASECGEWLVPECLEAHA